MSLEERRNDAGVLKIVAGLVCVLIAVGGLLVAASFAFSVVVSGTSMAPTLEPGDRIMIDLLHRHDVGRFDVVEVVSPPAPHSMVDAHGGEHIVKRVIGMPGDRIEIQPGDHPRVLVRPAGSSTTYVVASSTWSSQVGSSVSACCQPDGTSGSLAHWVTVPAGHYWVIGDNWGGSTDSRIFGWVPASDITTRLGRRLPLWASGSEVAEPARLVPLGSH